MKTFVLLGLSTGTIIVRAHVLADSSNLKRDFQNCETTLLKNKCRFKKHELSYAALSEKASPLAVEDDISYHPYGQVMTETVNIYNIYFGDFSSSPTTIQLMDYFASNIASTSWYQTVSKYYEYSAANNVPIPAASKIAFKFSAIISPNIRGAVYETDIIAGIQSFLQNYNLAPDPNAIYAVMFNGALQYTAPDQTIWLGDWCGYHGNFLYQNVQLKFTVLGDPATAANPNNGCQFSVCKSIRINFAFLDLVLSVPQGTIPPNGDFGADAMASIYSHELVETVTDPYLNAWFFNSDGEECMDRCAWTYSDYLPGYANNANLQVGARKFLVQQIYVPAVGCTMPVPYSQSPSRRPTRTPSRRPNFRPSTGPTAPPTRPVTLTPSRSYSPTTSPSSSSSKQPSLQKNQNAATHAPSLRHPK